MHMLVKLTSSSVGSALTNAPAWLMSAVRTLGGSTLDVASCAPWAAAASSVSCSWRTHCAVGWLGSASGGGRPLGHRCSTAIAPTAAAYGSTGVCGGDSGGCGEAERPRDL